MKKTYKIDVDCANCALKMEEAAKGTEVVGTQRLFRVGEHFLPLGEHFFKA